MNTSVHLIDLPSLIQTIQQQHRTGVLHVDGEGEECLIGFNQGSVCCLYDGRKDALWRGLNWTGLCDASKLGKHQVHIDPYEVNSLPLAEMLEEHEIVTVDGIRDAIDCYIEEGFTRVLAIADPQIEFKEKAKVNSWCRYQVKVGTLLPASGLLMEGLRRNDEWSRLGDAYGDPNALLLQEPRAKVPEDLDKSCRRILSRWQDGQSIFETIDGSGLPPSESRRALALLVESKVVRLATPAELVVLGSRLSGNSHRKELCLRRAMRLGAETAQTRITLAELADARGDTDQAIDDYLAAAHKLRGMDDVHAVMVVRTALALDGTSTECLRLLAELYGSLEEPEEQAEVLLDLADQAEKAGELLNAREWLLQAQSLLPENGNPAPIARRLAAIAEAQGDNEQALANYNLALTTCTQRSRLEEACEIRGRMLAIDPQLGHIAWQQAVHLKHEGKTKKATTILRAALKGQPEKDVEVLLRELLADLDESDTDNQACLVRLYQEREDRVGATEQLERIADTQEHRGDDDGLAETLARILDHDTTDGELTARYARVLTRLGRDREAAPAWLQAINRLIDRERLPAAIAVAEEAIAAIPWEPDLYHKAAQLAAREGDVPRQIRLLHKGARAARIADRLERASSLYERIIAVAPHHLEAHMERAECLVAMESEECDESLRQLVAVSLRAGNNGIAVNQARLRARLAPAPAFDQRSALVELLRRTGDHLGELNEGRQLVQDLLDAGDFDNAIELLQRLVASNPDNAELPMQLAELHEALGHKRTALRFLRHGIGLLQQQQAIERAVEATEMLNHLGRGDEAEQVRSLLEANEPINWQALKRAQHQAVRSDLDRDGDSKQSA